MASKRITQQVFERVALTEVTPYETPINFSNWGSFNYLRRRSVFRQNPALRCVFEKPGGGAARPRKWTTPMRFDIRKNLDSWRTLALLHPRCSEKLSDIYRQWGPSIVKACGISRFSIRAPSAVAKCYFTRGDAEKVWENVEEFDCERQFASSFFRYNRYSHLYKFYDSSELLSLEKRFPVLLCVDVSRCFLSIYTHSIEWAIDGKDLAKSRIERNVKVASLGSALDQFMQFSNDGETAGVPIGPEFSRIFSEIIFQRIDADVEDRLSNSGLRNGEHYVCIRYIDDFQVFARSFEVADKVLDEIRKELYLYRFTINESKTVRFERPFLSDKSRTKLNISHLFQGLNTAGLSSRTWTRGKLTSQFRRIVKEGESGISGIGSFSISAVRKTLKRLSNSDHTINKAEIFELLGLASYIYRVGPNLSQSYLYSCLVFDVVEILDGRKEIDRIEVLDRVVVEIMEFVEDAVGQGLIHECLNMLILLAEPQFNSKVPKGWAVEIYDKCTDAARRTHLRRLDYWGLVSFLYFANGVSCSSIVDSCIVTSKKILGARSISHDSESAHLFIDLLSCHFLSIDVRKDIWNAAQSCEASLGAGERNEQSIRQIGNHSWFFNWNERRNLRNLLRKKNFSTVY